MRRFLRIITEDTLPSTPGDSEFLSKGETQDAMGDEDGEGIEHVESEAKTAMRGDDIVAQHIIEPGLEPEMNPSLSALLRLRAIVAVLRGYADETVSEYKLVLDSLKDLAETMVWADQHDPNVWDLFLEFAVMPLLVRCLKVTASRPPIPHDTESLSAENFKRPTNQDPTKAEPEYNGVQVESEFVSRASQMEHIEIVQSGISKVSVGSGETNLHAVQASENVNESPSTRGLKGDSSFSHSTSLRDELPANAISTLSFSSSVAGDTPEASSPIERTKRYPSVNLDLGFIDRSGEIQAQILQTISIIIQSVSRQHSLLCLFSANHINEILSFEFAFGNDEVLAFFISAVKSIALKLDEGLLQLFFDPAKGSFPLYEVVTRFLDHPEAMVRIAVRNITLTIYALGDSEVLRVASRDEMCYFQRTVELLAKLCGSVALAFEFLLDDGSEIRRTRSRTGLFRRKVRTSELTAKLEEIENICSYLGDVSTVSHAYLHPLIVNLISSRLFSPFFRPIASLAAPASLQVQRRWRLSRAKPNNGAKPALPLFDAAARCLVLTCILTHCKTSPLGSVLVRDLCRPTAEFEHRHVLNGLKAMATDITGTERVTFVSLCAIEAFIRCEAATKQLLGNLKYDFYLDDVEEMIGKDGQYGSPKPFIHVGIPDEHDLQRRGSEQLLMTLSDFEAPLTPASSRPGTPTLTKAGSYDGLRTPPNGLSSRISSYDSGLGLNLSPNSNPHLPLERSDSDGILISFRHGETSLREAISSIVLVVRRREVRTHRVLYAIARIIEAVEKRTNDTNSCVDVSKIILDELATAVEKYVRDKRTTIVCIERMFDNFKSGLHDEESIKEEKMDLETIVSADRLPEIASCCPHGAGKRRRVQTEDTTPPIEAEDAHTFMMFSNLYDETLKWANALDKFGSLKLQIIDILSASGVEDSYLEKRYALEDTGKAVLKHGTIA